MWLKLNPTWKWWEMVQNTCFWIFLNKGEEAASPQSHWLKAALGAWGCEIRIANSRVGVNSLVWPSGDQNGLPQFRKIPQAKRWNLGGIESLSTLKVQAMDWTQLTMNENYCFPWLLLHEVLSNIWSCQLYKGKIVLITQKIVTPCSFNFQVYYNPHWFLK